MYVVVVLPFVPVTPINLNLLEGFLKKLHAEIANANLVSLATTNVTSAGKFIFLNFSMFSTNIADAPFSIASSI